ncbi:MAG TPA: hypothetical protein VFZ83_13465 [Acidimicrobiia bacterium]|nr:hypothetical protein [Acidimicrobiia bacterium]
MLVLAVLPVVGVLIGWDGARRRSTETLALATILAVFLAGLVAAVDHRGWVQPSVSVLLTVTLTKLAIVTRRRWDARTVR